MDNESQIWVAVGSLEARAEACRRWKVSHPGGRVVVSPDLHPGQIGPWVVTLNGRWPTLILTNNPLVLNELPGNRIWVAGLHDGQILVRTLNDTPGYHERASVYLNGELWLTFYPELEGIV